MVLVLTHWRLRVHSLEQLNNYSSETVVFGDGRAPGFVTVPPVELIGNININGTEGQTIESDVPFEFEEIFGVSNAKYTIDLRGLSGSQVFWPVDLPGNVTVTNPASGLWQLSGIQRLSEWEEVKNVLLTLGPDTSGIVPFKANLVIDPDNLSTSTITWFVIANMADTAEINTGTLSSVFYDEDIAKTFNSGLIITDTNEFGSYSVAVSKSILAAGTLASSGTGGTSNYAANVLTISGSKNQVNSRLGNIIFTPAQDFDQNFTLTYAVTNLTNSEVNTAVQQLLIGERNDEITNMYLPRTYISNQANTLFANNVPFIDDISSELNFVNDSYTALLLQFENNLTDSSSNNFNAIVSGTLTFSSSVKRFGSYSVLAGSGNFKYTNAGLKLPTDKFTIEMWVLPDSAVKVADQILFQFGEAYINLGMVAGSNNIIRLQINANNAGGIEASYQTVISVTDFTHVAVTYDQGLWIFHVNGTRIGSTTSVLSNLVASPSEVITFLNGFTGYVDQIRYSKGIARYPNANIPEFKTATYTISLTLNSTVANPGFIASSGDFINRTGWNASTNTYTYTGGANDCNNKFAQLAYYPTLDRTDIITVNYQQRINSVFQVSDSFTLTGIENTASIPGTGFITYNTVGTYTFTPTFEQVYYLNCDALVIGAGGLRGQLAQGSVTSYGGGGGAGALNIFTDINLTTSANYTVKVPAAGGGGAFIGSWGANGGTNGQNATLNGFGGGGGSSGNGFAGGNSTNSFNGGGGGGAAGPGFNAGGTSNLGHGGPGISSNFTGTTVVYSAGQPSQITQNPTQTAPTTPGSGGRSGLIVLKFYE